MKQLENRTHLMIDIETLSRQDDAVILSVAAIAFNPYLAIFDPEKCKDMPMNIFHEFPNIMQQLFNGSHIEPETLQWWREKSQAARNAILDGQDTSHANLHCVLKKLTEEIEFCRMANLDGKLSIWAQGCGFDERILAAAYRREGMPVPWKYNEWMDARSICAFADVEYDRSKTAHDAAEDCIAQIGRVVEAYKKIYAK